MKRRIILSISVFFIIASIYFNLNIRRIESSAATSVKDTLSSSQLSYFARIGSTLTAGDSTIRIYLTAGTAPSVTTNNLFVGDTIGIGTTGSGVGSSGPLTKYVVADIGGTGTIELSTGIGQSNAFIGAAIVATRSAIHTINFTPSANITGGFWQFLIKATSRSGEVANDGIPDQQGFDFGQDVGSTTTGVGARVKALDVSCPNWGTGVTSAYTGIGTTTAVATGGTTNYYHVVTCYMGVGGTNQVGIGYSMTIGRDFASGSQLINPSASLSHVEGNASSTGPDVYTFFVRQLDSAQNVVDTSQGKIAVIEAVKVSATVDPTLTFTIDNVGVTDVGSTACGGAGTSLSAGSANTSGTQVAFGSLNIGTSSVLAQRLSCITNAPGGYVVTTYEDAPMRGVGIGATIPDTACNGGGCTSASPTAWNSVSTSLSEFGYTMYNIGSSIPFTPGLYKPFGIGSTTAREIMKKVTTPITTESAYICYKITATTTQAAGNYESKIIYTATATF